jgi:hypothetical protein
MSTLRVDNLNARTGTKITIPTGTTLYAPGAIIQRQVGFSNTQFTLQTTTMSNVITATITPNYAASRIWLTASVNVGKRSTGELQFSHRFLRDGNPVTQQLSSARTTSTGNYDVFRCTGTADAAYHNHHVYYAYDEPNTTSTVTYTFQVAAPDAGYQAIYFNMSGHSYTTLIAEEMGK